MMVALAFSEGRRAAGYEGKGEQRLAMWEGRQGGISFLNFSSYDCHMTWINEGQLRVSFEQSSLFLSNLQLLLKPMEKPNLVSLILMLKERKG